MREACSLVAVRARGRLRLGVLSILGAFALLSLAPATSQAACDPLDPAVCLQPWPNDFFTVDDPTTDTGKRLNLQLLDMPRNVANNPIRPDEWNRNDGFSPGQEIVTRVPGLDNPTAFQRTGAVPITDIKRSYLTNQPIVVINARTRERHLIWSEIDSNPTDPANVNLIIRPAVNFEEGQRYIVALRNLRDADGHLIRPNAAFRTYLNRVPSTDPAVIARRPHMERIFRTLEQAKIQRKSLYLAWDFTVASERNLSERALYMRDDAFAQLGDTDLTDLTVQGSSPQFAVTRTCDDSGCSIPPTPELGCQSDTVDSRIARCVDGQVTVPCYLNQPGCPPGAYMTYLPGSSLPQRIPGNMDLANFECLIPRSAINGSQAVPARPSLYGHGLLGNAGEVSAGNIKAMADEHNFVFCATDWAGFSITDIPTVVSAIGDLSNFNKIPDHAQQGFLNFMYLGRLMIHPNGFSSNAAFQVNGQSVIDRTRLFYDGNSQGGIMGGSLAALAPDYNRAVLGVPGMNYSTLLQRSADFDPMYSQFLYPNYPNELERQLIFSLMNTLWDRGEANGFAHHMTYNPYPNTPPHTVLLHEAFGDHQVANVTTEVEARTIGAALRTPSTDPGRNPDVSPYFDITRITSFPYDGSAYVVWDSGSPTPPTTNTPPRAGADPHSHPRSDVKARQQKSDFLQLNGAVTDPCGPGPCYANGYTGP
jgi:hypothetical protein